MIERLLERLEKLENKDVITRKDQKEIEKLMRQIEHLRKKERKIK